MNTAELFQDVLVDAWKDDTALTQELERFLQPLLVCPDDPGVEKTPARFIKGLRQQCWGSFISKELFIERVMTTFENPDYDEMVLQVGIPMQSVCEHHLLPFIGKVSIAYIPHSYGGQIVGLSKLARIVDWLSARPQTQERLSEQIATFLYTELNANGVGVLIKSEHLCMTVRGVRAHGTHTVTSKLLGAFKDDPATRAEFLRLATEH